MADEETGEVEWTGVARIDPATVLVVGDDAVTAAELARWVRRHRERETVDWAPSWKWDAATIALLVVTCVLTAYLAVR